MRVSLALVSGEGCILCCWVMWCVVGAVLLGVWGSVWRLSLCGGGGEVGAGCSGWSFSGLV